MNARKARWIAFGIAVLVVAIVGTGHWYRSGLEPTGAAEAVVTVVPGATPKEIAAQLKKQGLIRSESAFAWYVKLHGLAPEIKSGRFELSGKQSASEIAQALTEESRLATQFTIPEGLTQAGVADRLEQLNIVAADDFKELKAGDFPEYDFLHGLPPEASLEGYLFPETYTIPPVNASAHDIAKIMLDQFRKELAGFRNAVVASDRPLPEIITLASLVEEEVRTPEDRKLVAGILLRRLTEGIRLDIDATVRYAVDKPDGALTANDLRSANPYNTRRFTGLPPGPIANPGREAILAVLEPTGSPYLFYLSAPDGTTHYARTNDEHEENKARYLR